MADVREVENKISVESEGDRLDLNYFKVKKKNYARVGNKKKCARQYHRFHRASVSMSKTFKFLTVNSMGTLSRLYTTMLRAVYSDP